MGQCGMGTGRWRVVWRWHDTSGSIHLKTAMLLPNGGGAATASSSWRWRTRVVLHP